MNLYNVTCATHFFLLKIEIHCKTGWNYPLKRHQKRIRDLWAVPGHNKQVYSPNLSQITHKNVLFKHRTPMHSPWLIIYAILLIQKTSSHGRRAKENRALPSLGKTTETLAGIQVGTKTINSGAENQPHSQRSQDIPYFTS